MKDLQKIREAPSKERPIQTNSTASEVNPQELVALEAMRKGLCSAGIDHDSWDFVADRCLQALKEAGALRLAPDIEEVIRGVDPNVPIDVSYAVFGCFRRPNGVYRASRTKAEAEEIAAAIVAGIPGEVSVKEGGHGVSHWLDVRAEGQIFTIYYTPEESRP